MDKRQIARITKMESYLDEAGPVISDLEKALLAYEKIEKDYYMLENYYGSVRWMDDYDADEKGLLPDDLKRGVLSEDAVYDLITEHRNLMVRLQKAVLKSMEEGI